MRMCIVQRLSVFSKFMGAIKPPSIRTSLSKENLLANDCDTASVDRQLQSPARDVPSAWRYDRRMNQKLYSSLRRSNTM